MGVCVEMDVFYARHLYWRGDRTKFVTLCPDGNVILDGRVMTLETATEAFLRASKPPLEVFWER